MRLRILNQRKVTFICFFIMLGIVAAYAFHMEPGQAVWLYGVVAAVCAFVCLRRKFLIAACLAALCLGNFVFIQSYTTDFSNIKPNTEYAITGTVCDYPLKAAANTRYTLSNVTLAVGGEAMRFPKNVQLASPNNTFVYGDVVTFESAVYPPDGETMPGAFNERIYLAGKQAGFSAYSANVKKTGHVSTLYTPFLQARAALERNIDAMYSPDAAPVAKAMFLGLQNEISQDVYTSFSKTGITHILSISGLHISLIALLLDFLLSKTKLGRNKRYVLNIALLLLYTSITGFPVSVVRAALMTVLYLVARWRFAERDTLEFLSAAMLVTLLASPAQLFMPGFLLSYGTVFGILCATPPLKRLWDKAKKLKPGGTGEAVCVSAAATAASAPMTAYYFNNIAWIAPAANFYAIPVSSGILVFTALSALFSVLWLQAGQFFAVISESLIKFLIILNNSVSAPSFGFTQVYRFPVWAGAAVFGALFVASDYFMVKRRVKAAALACILGASVLGFALSMPTQNPLAIRFLDVENGEAVHIAYNQKNILLSNATSSAAYNANSYSARNGVAYDLFVLTEGSPGHMEGALSILQSGRVKGAFAYTDMTSDMEETCHTQGIRMRAVQKYDTLWEDGGLKITALQNNYRALTLLVSLNGKNLCLLSGHSAGRSKGLNVSAPVLRLASEGAETSLSQTFLQTVAPQYAVISTYNNPYGLPAEKALQLLRGAGVQTYRTDKDYTITMTADEAGNIQMRTMHENQ